MPLRLHFPWGLLLTAAGFAVFGAAVAFFVATDFHGYLHRQCLLHAIGAGLLGSLAWTFSERISFAANLNTRPALRLTLSGAAAICVAGPVVARFIEFSVGTSVYWAEPAAVLLYVAAGILPAVAGVALIAAIETALAARRGGSELRSALRPILPYAGLGVVLIGIIAYCAIELHSDIAAGVLAIAPDRTQKSGWLERRQALFASALNGASCEVMVVPFEAVEAPGSMRSLDRPARSLITRYVAAEIAARTGACVADVTMVSRALGSRARAYDAKAVASLAESMGVRTIVRGNVALAGDRLAYELTIRADSRAPGEKARWTSGEATQWGPIDFSDELPPEAAFQPLTAAVVERLGFLSGKTVSAGSHAADERKLPDELRKLSEDPGSPAARARLLQIVALAYPRSDVDGESVWERSILALAAAPAEDESARVLRAQAALHLYRRPYALTLLRGLASPEARALLAIAQGNLFEAEALAAELRDPAAYLTTAVELETMRYKYGRAAGYRERRSALLDRYPAFGALLYVTLSTDEWFEPTAHDLVRRQLSAMGVPIVESAPIALLRLAAKQFGQELFFAQDISRLALAIEDGYAPLWTAHARTWGRQVAADRLADWDVYDALYAASRTALVNSAGSIGERQDRPQAFLEFTRDLGQSFAGYPPLAAHTARVLGYMRLERKTSPDSTLDRRHANLLRDLAAWEGGETELAALSAAKVEDEPMRPWRLAPFLRPDRDQAGRPMDRQHLAANATHYLRASTFSQYTFDYLTWSHDMLLRSGQKERAEQVVAEAQERFIGSGARDAFLLRQAEAKGDLPAYVALLEAKLREQPEEWTTYYRLALVQLQAHEPERAQRTLLSYPLFTGDKANPVELSNRASSGGFLLLKAGDAKLAQALFQLSARYQTGSAAEMWSGMALAQIDNQWRGAAEWGRRLHERYQDGDGFSAAAYASFLAGDQEQGLRDFYQASKQFEDMRAWNAAIAGHRIAATSHDELVGFVKRWKSLSGQVSVDGGLRQHFLFNILMIDRPPSEKAVATLQAVGAGGPVLNHLAIGYNAFRQGDYPVAIDMFGLLTRLTTVKSENMKYMLAYPLPYYVASLAKAGRGAEAREQLVSYRDRIGKDFYYLLAAAYLDGMDGRTQEALDGLWLAQFNPPDMADVTFPPLFQHLETCEKLYELTNDDRFRKLLLDLAVRQQVSWPHSWAYTFEAKYAADARERERALGIGLYLDPQSERLAGFGAKERRLAAERFAKNNTFRDK